jgi:hypothetical protein
LKGWSLAELHRRLTAYRDPCWRRLLGLPYRKIPAYSTLVERSHHSRVKAWERRLYRRLLSSLLNGRNLGLLAVDMTDLPQDLRDRLAHWGVCGKGKFYGYKLHLLTTRDGVPLAVVATRANRTEPTVTGSLLRHLRCHLTEGQLERLRFAVADAAYDTHGVYDSFAELRAQLIAVPNPRKNAELKGPLARATRRELRERGRARDRGILLYHSCRGRKLHRERIIVDQVFGQLKGPLRLGELPWWVRGVRWVQERAERAVLAFVAILAVNKLRRNGLREVACYVA